MPIPLLAPALDEREPHQDGARFTSRNCIGGLSTPGEGASGASRAASCDSCWDSRNGREDARRDHDTTRYLLDGLSILAQYASDGTRQEWYTQSHARIDEVLSVVNEDGKLWYQADALGSIYGLADSSGALAAKTGYDVFGAPMPPPPPGAGGGQPFGFTGREHDLDAGLVYARARYLSPSTGRWDRPDPMGFVDGPNLYLYAGSRPTAFADATGHNWNPSQIAHASVSAAITLAVSAVLAAVTSSVGPAMLDTAGLAVFAAAIGSMGSLAGGIAWELVFWGPQDNAQDLIADALGTAAGATVWLAITGLLAPRNLAWASLLAGVYVPVAVGLALGGYQLAHVCWQYR